MRPLCRVTLAVLFAIASALPVAAQQTPPPQAQPGAFDLLFDQGKRLFDAFQYDEAVPLFDRLISGITEAGAGTRPDLLVQAYEMRARARFALGDATGTEQDFAALLAIRPDFRLSADISPRVVAVFDGVRALTVGTVVLSSTPPGPVMIDDRTYEVLTEPVAIDVVAGAHVLAVKRQGFSPFEQSFTALAGTRIELTVSVERISASLSVVTRPADVEVVIDGTPRGRTPAGRTADGPSAPLVITDLPLGEHRIELRRECYVTLSLPLALTDDVATEPLELTRAVATARIQTTAGDAIVFVDGEQRGPVTQQSQLTLCEGARVIEVRGPSGRFVDRRAWKRGESATITAELKSAFPIVVTAAGSAAVTPAQLGQAVERATAAVPHALIYAPVASELEAALAAFSVPADWLNTRLGVEGGTSTPREVVRDLVSKISSRLGVQGIAAVATGTDPYEARVLLFAAGSGEPDSFTIHTADTGSQRRVAEQIGAALPPIIRPSLETSVVDVAGVSGAVVVRTGDASAAAGLGVGDVIVGAQGSPVASVADLRATVASVGPSAPLGLEVRNPAGETRAVSASIAMVVDTMPMRDPSTYYNLALLDLRQRAARAAPQAETAAVNLNLAVVLMRLGNWDEALAALGKVQLPEGAGVSAGTVAYLRGLCLEGAGRTTEAQAAFAAAANAGEARLSSEGPLIAPLARARLSAGR